MPSGDNDKATIGVPEEIRGRDGAADVAAKMEERESDDSTRRRLYSSPNGDSWYLVHDTQGVAVVHIPNVPSGGRVERMDVGEFLIRGGNGPERQELIRLIASLAHDA
jgi:hypothetical protein